MFGKSITQRVKFFSVSPLASSLVHWVVGSVYMLQISIFVSLLRGVLHNGVLYFLRDPANPNYNLFRDLIDDPVHKHACRVRLSVAVDGNLIVMLDCSCICPSNLPCEWLHPFSHSISLHLIHLLKYLPTCFSLYSLCNRAF
ncbi:hypothetical protein P3S67_019811 [Capsicum chacoense]